MSRSVVLLVGLSVAAVAQPPARLSDEDFRQLMQSVIATSTKASEVQSTTKTICIQRELGDPLESSKAIGGGAPGWSPPRNGVAVPDLPLKAAMSPNAVVAHQATMPPLPSKYVLISKGSPPRRCMIDKRWAPIAGQPSPGSDSAVVLSFTRPALASGYAFIEEYEECPGLCGTNFLRVFRKEHGKWTQFTRTILSIS